MRKDETAELMVYCPTCGNSVNEYNWTLAHAARYSKGNTSTETFISIILNIINNPDYKIGEQRIMCPRCNERIKLKLIPMPDPSLVEEYVEKVGKDYVYAKY